MFRQASTQISSPQAERTNLAQSLTGPRGNFPFFDDGARPAASKTRFMAVRPTSRLSNAGALQRRSNRGSTHSTTGECFKVFNSLADIVIRIRLQKNGLCCISMDKKGHSDFSRCEKRSA